jgi:hypothetical protein
MDIVVVVYRGMPYLGLRYGSTRWVWVVYVVCKTPSRGMSQEEICIVTFSFAEVLGAKVQKKTHSCKRNAFFCLVNGSAYYLVELACGNHVSLDKS